MHLLLRNKKNAVIMLSVRKMSKLDRLFIKSYILDEKKDNDFFDCVGAYYNTDEFQSMRKNIQHGDISVVQHILSVAYISFRISRKLKFDFVKTAKGALLHDLFYYDWHDPDPSHRLHGYYHPGFALKNARELSRKIGAELSELEENIIHRHMFPLTPVPPKFKESILVCIVDKYVATKEIYICRFPKIKDKFLKKINDRKPQYAEIK